MQVNLCFKVPWPGICEVIFRASSQAATSSPYYHTQLGFNQLCPFFCRCLNLAPNCDYERIIWLP